MKKNIFAFAIIFCALIFPNLSNAQFGIELNYGMNGSYQPSYNGFTHFGGGINYDINETFGAKIDFASDKFSIENELGDKTGTSNTRVSLQGIINVSNLIDDRSSYNDFQILAHGGAGISILKSDINTTGTDHIVNVIIGLNPQYKVAEGIFLGIDASFIANISQHYNFDGTSTYVGNTANSITGLMYNLSATVSYKFGSY
jgi:OOP family OmpA-OmpF porin